MVERSAAVTAGTSLPDEFSQSPETSRHWHRHICLDDFMPSLKRSSIRSARASLSSGEQTLVKLQILKQHKEMRKIISRL